jgi:cell division protein FtsI (penicillin-binding protein 3)
MTKQPRLRVQKEKRGRRIALYLLLVLLVGAICYYLEQRYEVVAYMDEVIASVKKTFSQQPPVRGTIYDRNLKQVAINKERVSVYIRTREIESISDAVEALGLTLDLDRDKLQAQLESGELRFWVAEDISQAQEVAIEGLSLPGVYLQSEDKRFYPSGSQAAHLIGYVDDGIGLSGVEYYYDRLLASRKLKQQEERKPLSSAQDLVLTLDLKIQSILEEIVRQISKNENATRVAAYLLESGTGEIVAGVQLPGFDPNSFTRYSQKVLANMFLEPLYIPQKFRLFMRDAASLQGQADKSTVPPVWSLFAEESDLGSQLRLWERLGLNDSAEIDFHISELPGEFAAEQHKPVLSSQNSFGLVPEYTTSLGLLTAFSSLLGNREKIRPFVVQKILDIETGMEVLLSEKDAAADKSADRPSAHPSETEYLFRSLAREGVSKSYFLRDKILLSFDKAGRRQLLINDLTYVTIPAGSDVLNMLVVVQVNPEGVARKIKKKRDLEQIIEEKVERISVLRQVSKSVADVLEPQQSDDGNFQRKKAETAKVTASSVILRDEQSLPGKMLDLRGLSLRKSLRLLKGIELKINIQGTGIVVDQRPSPGSSLKGIKECLLILEKNENINLEKLSKGRSPKK